MSYPIETGKYENVAVGASVLEAISKPSSTVRKTRCSRFRYDASISKIRFTLSLSHPIGDFATSKTTIGNPNA
jgi:hypothetical protein